MSASMLEELGAWVPREELGREIADGLTPDRFEDSAWDYACLLVGDLEIDETDVEYACQLIYEAYEQIWESRARVR